MEFVFNYRSSVIGKSTLIHADCFEWLERIPAESIHAIVTDPPYGVKEYEPEQLEKRSNGKGGVWRLPPAFDGNVRAPLPRFTALNDRDRELLSKYFRRWSLLATRSLKPGGHLFIASNTFLSNHTFSSVVNEELEFRGEIIRLVKTLRGGDRPKNAEREFYDVCSLPKGAYEPWGLFRKKLPDGMTVGECLRTNQTGGLRRKPDGSPFEDVIRSARTPKDERSIVDHPSLKPQEFLRNIVYAALPLGKGILLDPFSGSGSTIAAAEALGYRAIGLERNEEYFMQSLRAVSRLSAKQCEFDKSYQLELPLS